MATPATVSSTTRTSTVARAEPRWSRSRAVAQSRNRDNPLCDSAIPRFRDSVSSRISVAAGPGDGDQDVIRCSRGEGGGKGVGHDRVVADGQFARVSRGVLEGDAAIRQDDAAERERDRVRAVLQVHPDDPRRRRLRARGACANRDGLYAGHRIPEPVIDLEPIAPGPGPEVDIVEREGLRAGGAG